MTDTKQKPDGKIATEMLQWVKAMSAKMPPSRATLTSGVYARLMLQGYVVRIVKENV